ncbi:MAG: hypothetical protein WC750_02845 [Patescibacteria group bacterium]|jgi:hypothetical protein
MFKIIFAHPPIALDSKFPDTNRLHEVEEFISQLLEVRFSGTNEPDTMTVLHAEGFERGVRRIRELIVQRNHSDYLYRITSCGQMGYWAFSQEDPRQDYKVTKLVPLK